MKTLIAAIEKQEADWQLWYDWEGDFADLKYCIGEFVLTFLPHSNN
jgi:hypothetical protein